MATKKSKQAFWQLQMAGVGKLFYYKRYLLANIKSNDWGS